MYHVIGKLTIAAGRTNAVAFYQFRPDCWPFVAVNILRWGFGPSSSLHVRTFAIGPFIAGRTDLRQGGR